MDFETLLYDVKEGVATITLNRPERHNAFNVVMANELKQAWQGVERPRGRSSADGRFIYTCGAHREDWTGEILDASSGRVLARLDGFGVGSSMGKFLQGDKLLMRHGAKQKKNKPSDISNKGEHSYPWDGTTEIWDLSKITGGGSPRLVLKVEGRGVATVDGSRVIVVSDHEMKIYR